MPGALSVFAFCLHITSTHQIRFHGPDTATGRVHVFNRNGVEWEGAPELFDVGAVYDDSYAASWTDGGSPAGSSTPPTWAAAGSPG